MADRFFTSYASRDQEVDKLDKVVERLSELVVGELGHGDKKAIGFFALDDIKTGTEWEKVLGDAVGSDRVIVCFLSPSYFNSQYCAKEFEVFRLRLEQAGEKYDGTPIIPVLWRIHPIPQHLKALQNKDGRFPARYAENGLSVLRQIKSQRDNFNTSLGVLARIIKEAFQSKPLPAFGKKVLFDALTNSFHHPQPGRYGIACTVLTPSGAQWRARVGADNMAELVGRVASTLGIGWREIPAGKLVDEAESIAVNREVLLLIGEEATVGQPPWSGYLAQLAAKNPANVVLMLGVQDDVAEANAPLGAGTLTGHGGGPALPPDHLEVLLKGLSHVIKRGGRFPVAAGKPASEVMAKCIETIRLEMIAEDAPHKVTHADLSAAAKDDGIDLTGQPSVSPSNGTGA